MEIEIEFNDQAKSGIRKTFLLSVIRRTLAESGLVFLHGNNVSLSVANVSEKEIKKINQAYRRKNSVTDILSFAEYKNQKELALAREKNIFLGELVLCYNDIASYAKKTKISARQETAKVLSHGTLHLLGFRHGKKMFCLQDKIARDIK